MKLNGNDTYKKNEKRTSIFSASNKEDVVDTAHLDAYFSKGEVEIMLIEKEHIEFKLRCDEQSEDEALSEWALITTIQTFW